MNQETWEERFYDGIEANNIVTLPPSDWKWIKDFFRTELKKAREEEKERQYDLIMESLPKDAENLSTLTPDQSLSLIKSFLNKKPWN
jgi:hypothetical protein